MNELALFAGAGGGILGGHLLGWRTVCAVEWDAYAASILVQRQNDGCLPPFAIWDDVQTFDGRPWRGRVDVISGGFPCTDISCAGRGAGIEGKESGMWKHMARIVGEVRPRFVFVENSPMLVGRGLARVLCDLAEMGYDAKWGVVGAHHVAAPHKRDRIWIVGNSDSKGKPVESFHDEAPELQEDVADSHGSKPTEKPRDSPEVSGVPTEIRTNISSSLPRGSGEGVADSERTGLEGQSGDEQRGSEPGRQRAEAGRSTGQEGLFGRNLASWWATEPGLGRVAHGVANRVDRLKCIGNGQVPQCAALAWETLSK